MTFSPEGIVHATSMKQMLQEFYADVTVPPEIVTCMFLLKEQHAGEQSFFAPYLDLLPPPSRFVSVQEPCIFAETPDIFSKEPYISAKEPYVLAQGATSGGVFRPISLSLFVVAACRCVRKRALHFRKRALYFRERALFSCQIICTQKSRFVAAA